MKTCMMFLIAIILAVMVDKIERIAKAQERIADSIQPVVSVTATSAPIYCGPSR